MLVHHTVMNNKTGYNSATKAPQEWDRIAAMPEFRALLAAKARFIVPATVFFLVYYFTLPVLVGWYPKLMKEPLLGPLNGAYLFALSQFAMTWIVAILYTRAAAKFDEAAKQILLQSKAKGE